MSIYKSDRVERIKLNMSTTFEQRSGLSYSKFDFMRHEVGISFDTFAELYGLRTYDDMPLSKIKIKVKDPQNTADLANRLRTVMASKNSNTVWDYS